jgi:hypothetical protein
MAVRAQSSLNETQSSAVESGRTDAALRLHALLLAHAAHDQRST